jgi:hypothetical protein
MLTPCPGDRFHLLFTASQISEHSTFLDHPNIHQSGYEINPHPPPPDSIKFSFLTGPDLNPPQAPTTISSKLGKDDWTRYHTHCSLRILRRKDCNTLTRSLLHVRVPVIDVVVWSLKGKRVCNHNKGSLWLLSPAWGVEENPLEEKGHPPEGRSGDR